jgi:hypothetical protein
VAESNTELVIPVYLDTNVLLDLLATAEDGFAMVERVTSSTTAGQTSERHASGEFTPPTFLNLFKLGLSGRLGKTTTSGSDETTEADRTHTYGSLLHRLRRYLVTEQLLNPVDDDGAGVEVGGFVELQGVVRPNPFTSSFSRLQKVIKFAEVAVQMAGQVQPQQQGQKGKSSGGGRPSREAVQMKAISDFLELLTADVEREGTTTIVVETRGTPYRGVVTLFDSFLRDRSMAELMNREFRVLGKVARHLPAGSSEQVDLLSSSGVGGMPQEMLEQLTGMIEQMAGQGMAQIGRPSMVVDPPVIELIPVAIYL